MNKKRGYKSAYQKKGLGGIIGTGLGAVGGALLGNPAVGAQIGGMIGSQFDGDPNAQDPEQVKTYGSGRLAYGGGYTSALGKNGFAVTGKSHEQGGVMMSSNVEVEGQETIDTSGNEGYVFSKRLMVPKTKQTFADRHKELIKLGAGPRAIEDLKAMQERVSGRDSVNLGNSPKGDNWTSKGAVTAPGSGVTQSFGYGGSINKKYQTGGFTDPIKDSLTGRYLKGPVSASFTPKAPGVGTNLGQELGRQRSIQGPNPNFNPASDVGQELERQRKLGTNKSPRVLASKSGLNTSTKAYKPFLKGAGRLASRGLGAASYFIPETLGAGRGSTLTEGDYDKALGIPLGAKYPVRRTSGNGLPTGNNFNMMNHLGDSPVGSNPPTRNVQAPNQEGVSTPPVQSTPTTQPVQAYTPQSEVPLAENTVEGATFDADPVAPPTNRMGEATSADRTVPNGGVNWSSALDYALPVAQGLMGAFGKNKTRPATQVKRTNVNQSPINYNINPLLEQSGASYRAILSNPNASAGERLAALSQKNRIDSQAYATKSNVEMQMGERRNARQAGLDANRNAQQASMDERRRVDVERAQANLGLTGNFARMSLSEISAILAQKRKDKSLKESDLRQIRMLEEYYGTDPKGEGIQPYRTYPQN